jgi:hypothetical protein
VGQRAYEAFKAVDDAEHDGTDAPMADWSWLSPGLQAKWKTAGEAAAAAEYQASWEAGYDVGYGKGWDDGIGSDQGEL